MKADGFYGCLLFILRWERYGAKFSHTMGKICAIKWEKEGQIMLHKLGITCYMIWA